MITPDLLEVWSNAKQEAESKGFELLWNERYRCNLYKSGKRLESFQIGLGLLKSLRTFLTSDKDSVG